MTENVQTGKALVLFSSLFETGGIQRYNKHLCDAFLTQFPNTSFTGILLDPVGLKSGDKWKNIRIKFIGNIKNGFLRKSLYAFYVGFLIVRNPPSFLICAHPGLSSIAFFAGKIFGIKYAVVTYGTDVWGVDRGLKFIGLRSAALIVTISRYTKDVMISNGINAEKIKIIPCAADLSLFKPDPVNKKMAGRFHADTKTILFTSGRICSLERYKGHDILLDVMRKLDESFVWIVAGDGDDRSRLMKKSEEYGLIDRVYFPGRVDISDLVEYYNLCDIFIMPSTGEGFGIVFLEAMACGKPVIGGGMDGSREPLMDGRLGYLVDPGNAEEIVQVIRKVGSEKEKRNDPDFLREQVREHFGIESFRAKVKDAFREYI